MATMVDEEVLGHTLGDRKTKVLLDQGQREIDAGRNAGRGLRVAVATEDAIGPRRKRTGSPTEGARHSASASSPDAQPAIRPPRG
jgi:hypothetical protein